MAPKKVSKDQIAGMLSELAQPAPGSGIPLELRTADVVTYPALAGLLSTMEERHNGLVALLDTRFKHLEDMGREHSEQLRRTKAEIMKDVDQEVARNDKRFNGVLIAVLLVVMGEVARLLFR